VNSTSVSIAVFVCTFGGALLGMRLSKALPEHHLDSGSRDTIKLGIGLIATMTALVLGLITASAKGSFDAVDGAVKQAAIQVLTLDRTLARYGPETAEIRQALQRLLGARIQTIWPEHAVKLIDLDPLRSGSATMSEGLADAIRGLKPRDDHQRGLQSRALDITEALLQMRWLVLADAEASVPLPFLLILFFWLTATFTCFGLLAPRHGTVIAVLFICALSIASALFLVLEMGAPFDGVLRVSGEPLRNAYTRINQ